METVAASKTLTKVLAKNIELSKHLDPNLLKYPLTINFFDSFDNLLKYLKINLKGNSSNIIFVNADNVALKENDFKSFLIFLLLVYSIVLIFFFHQQSWF